MGRNTLTVQSREHKSFSTPIFMKIQKIKFAVKFPGFFPFKNCIQNRTTNVKERGRGKSLFDALYHIVSFTVPVFMKITTAQRKYFEVFCI